MLILGATLMWELGEESLPADHAQVEHMGRVLCSVLTVGVWL